MKKSLLLLAFITPTFCVNAQAIYLDSLENAFSASFGLGLSSDANSYGFGGAYTINGAINFGLLYVAGNQDIDREDEYQFKGSGLGGYISFNLLNELRDDSFGVELGFLYEKITFDRKKSDNQGFTNRSFGVGLNFSKQTTPNPDNSKLIAQVGITAFPISETEYEDNSSSGTTVDPFILGNFALTILANTKSISLALEPGVSYNFKHEVAGFTFTTTIIF